MLLIKILAYLMIVQGVIFTVLAVVVIIEVDEWFAIVAGLVVLGPISFVVGILVLKKLKSNVSLEALKKLTKKSKK